METREIGLTRQRGSRHEGSVHSDGAWVVHAGSVQLGSVHPTPWATLSYMNFRINDKEISLV